MARAHFVFALASCGVAAACFYGEPRDKDPGGQAAIGDAQARSGTPSEASEATIPEAGDDPCPDDAGCTLPRVVQIAAGAYHTCARLADRSVRCWGLNDHGQLGDGTTTNRSRPVRVRGLSRVVFLALGAGHSCAITEASAVVCWGSNGAGQLGDGTYDDRPTPTQVPQLPHATQLALGGKFTCALDDAGSVRCWGVNQNGELGDGTALGRSAPSLVLAPEGPDAGHALTGVARIVAGVEHVCALDGAGRIACWGANGARQVGTGSSLPIETRPVRPAWTGFLSLALGREHTCARMADRVVRCWGGNTSHQLATPTPHGAPEAVPELPPTTDLWSGNERTYARLEDGNIRAWGRLPLETLDAGTPTALPALASVAEVAVGDEHTCARNTDGAVRCWGTNAAGQLGDGSEIAHGSPVPVLW